jgi:hypothetical protein
MTEPEVLGLIVTLATLIGGVLAVWWRIEGRIKAAEMAATLKAESAFAAAQMLAEKLAEHRLHSAETFVTKAGLRDTTEQITDPPNGSQSRFSSLLQIGTVNWRRLSFGAAGAFFVARGSAISWGEAAARTLSAQAVK